MATYVGDRIYGYKNLLGTPSIVYTNTTDLVTGMTLYDNTGVDIGERIGNIVNPSSFDLDPIRYISVDGTTFNFDTAYVPRVFAIGKNWINVVKKNTYNTYHIDLSTNTPSITTINLGEVQEANAYLSNANNMFFSSRDVTNKIFRKLKMNTSTGELTEELSVTGGSRILGFTENAIATVLSQRDGSTAYYYDHVYWNGVEKYTLPRSNRLYGEYIQVSDDTLGIIKVTNAKYATITESGYTEVGTIQTGGSASNFGFLRNKNEIFNTTTTILKTDFTGNYIYRRSNSNPISPLNSYTGGTNNMIGAIGILNNYMYCINLSNYPWSESSVVKLIILDVSDWSVVYEKVLPNDPFNEYDGLPTFWVKASCIATESYTGYLGYGFYNTTTNKYNVVRIAQIL